MKIANSIVELLGRWSNRYCPDVILDKITGFKQHFYIGRLKPRFKKMEGWINGRVSLHCPQYISVGEGSIINDGVRLLCYDKFNDQTFIPQITIGRNTKIQENCFLSSTNMISIGDNVAITEHTVILDNIHGDFLDHHLTFNNNPDVPDVFLQEIKERPLFSKGPVRIEDSVHVGMFCTILPSTKIGHHSIIAAHSVVSGRIPPYSLVAGNPARIVMTFGRKKKNSEK